MNKYISFLLVPMIVLGVSGNNCYSIEEENMYQLRVRFMDVTESFYRGCLNDLVHRGKISGNFASRVRSFLEDLMYNTKFIIEISCHAVVKNFPLDSAGENLYSYITEFVQNLQMHINNNQENINNLENYILNEITNLYNDVNHMISSYFGGKEFSYNLAQKDMENIKLLNKKIYNLKNDLINLSNLIQYN